ncbi:T-cell surface glycoprotein CD8 beta chain-like [Emydura macquarii macquarii]|uniref:T-cell surface glycoprotein CD8 beta chain-like n=1 Tax=Emydura macquarii macquarii TaxID=1129001 RepID=UPI00352ABC2C
MSCTVEPPLPPGALMASWHRGGRATGLGRAWLENGSTSILSLRALRGNDSGLYCCRLILLLLGQPCLLWGPGTRLVVTGPSAQNTTWSGLRGNVTQSERGHRTLPPHHWTIRLLALGAGVVLTAAVVLCLRRRQGEENRE